ncbi:MAG TPA: hypothetical protein PKC99_18145 [Anaerolineales bacterium]|nr:hypothetical protein [Anaerolineales bacterium]
MKFRKVFVSCLALVLALSMALQSAPALAQSKSTESGAGFQGVLASVKKVSLLEGFPPRIRIDGALPPGCTSLIVDKPVVGKPNPDTSITPITIRVRGVWQIGAVCTILPKRFTTTVTIDPFKLNLAPGLYLVRVNPRKGQYQNQILINIPPGLD